MPNNSPPPPPPSTPSAPKQSAGQIIGIVLGVICITCLIILTMGSLMNQPFGWILVWPILQCLCNILSALLGGNSNGSMMGGKKSKFEKIGE